MLFLSSSLNELNGTNLKLFLKPKELKNMGLYLVHREVFSYFSAKVWAYYSKCPLCIRAIEYNDVGLILRKEPELHRYIDTTMEQYGVSIKENIIKRKLEGSYICASLSEWDLLLKQLRSICKKLIKP